MECNGTNTPNKCKHCSRRSLVDMGFLQHSPFHRIEVIRYKKIVSKARVGPGPFECQQCTLFTRSFGFSSSMLIESQTGLGCKAR